MKHEDMHLKIAKMIATAYSTGDFEPLFPLMTNNYEHHSYWVWDPMVGKETVIPYYRGKGNAIRKSDSKIRTEIVRISEPHTIQPDTLYVNGEKAKPGSKLCLFVKHRLHFSPVAGSRQRVEIFSAIRMPEKYYPTLTRRPSDIILLAGPRPALTTLHHSQIQLNHLIW